MTFSGIGTGGFALSSLFAFRESMKLYSVSGGFDPTLTAMVTLPFMFGFAKSFKQKL